MHSSFNIKKFQAKWEKENKHARNSDNANMCRYIYITFFFDMTTFSIHQVPNITHKMPNWLFFYDKNKILSKVKEKDVQALHESEVLTA
jgi:hypothetical protein